MRRRLAFLSHIFDAFSFTMIPWYNDTILILWPSNVYYSSVLTKQDFIVKLANLQKNWKKSKYFSVFVHFSSVMIDAQIRWLLNDWNFHAIRSLTFISMYQEIWTAKLGMQFFNGPIPIILFFRLDSFCELAPNLCAQPIYIIFF